MDWDQADDPKTDLIAKLLDQNAKLIEALTTATAAANPIALIDAVGRALNPPAPPSAPAGPTDPYASDRGRDASTDTSPAATDPWADADVQMEELLAQHRGRGGIFAVGPSTYDPDPDTLDGLTDDIDQLDEDGHP